MAVYIKNKNKNKTAKRWVKILNMLEMYLHNSVLRHKSPNNIHVMEKAVDSY